MNPRSLNAVVARKPVNLAWPSTKSRWLRLLWEKGTILFCRSSKQYTELFANCQWGSNQPPTVFKKAPCHSLQIFYLASNCHDVELWRQFVVNLSSSSIGFWASHTFDTLYPSSSKVHLVLAQIHHDAYSLFWLQLLASVSLLWSTCRRNALKLLISLCIMSQVIARMTPNYSSFPRDVALYVRLCRPQSYCYLALAKQ